ncbi:phage virion morphogenesis protein [Acidovorax delafieldii]|uniref:phage virion morphogenesis protein n=1 Tax=Acidovorax delafieldii TaxID=47920 RepID=UPI002862D165|nr:phage virion morphogenesis protein [Acidovorax delafieldii]MDR6152195.1 phage virion morphogenesis protein [Acidovorax delafieldii]
MDDLSRLEDWVTPLLAKLSVPEQRALARTVARELRAGNAQQMRAQQAPDGTGWEPRKASGLRNGRGSIRRQAKSRPMMQKLRAAKHLKASATASEALVGFVGRAERIARVHHFGLRDRVKTGGPEYDYPARQLLGITDEQIERVRELLMKHLAE